MPITTHLARSLILLAALTLLAGPVRAAPVGVTVVVENRAPADGTWLTPVWVGFHSGSFDLYDDGDPASAALERLAEDGNATPLSALFDQSGGTGTQGVIAAYGAMPQLAPGESASRTFVLDADAASNRYFSWASMVIPSNDAFVAGDDPQAQRIFDNAGNFLGGFFIVSGEEVRDAGTEMNDELPANTAFFGQDTPDSGVPENGVVHIHPGYMATGSGGILDDPDFAGADFTAAGYEVASVTLYRSDTIISSSAVSGDWTVSGSPYIVQTDVTVPLGESLNIEPGVVVHLEAGHELRVEGTLEAIGSEDAPIRFSGPSSGTGWGGLRVSGAGASAQLEHCIVEHGDRNPTYDEGGGLACYGGSLVLRDCQVRDNASYLDGAGIYAIDASVIIEDSDIGPNLIDSGNSASGGGLYAENCELQISGSRFHDNRVETFTFFGATNSRGGGLALVDPAGVVERCVVDGNYITHSGTAAESTGGGIYVDADFEEDFLLRGNTVVDNEVNYTNAHGGGIYLIGYYVELVDNLVADNVGHGIWFDGGGETSEVSYNDVWGNSDGDYGGGFVPSGVGVITQTNANGDPCDDFFNISLDPLFVARVQDDYHLQLGSPCIDAGDPGAPQDPDGTVADIGAFYYPHKPTSAPIGRDEGRIRMLMRARPAPMTGSTIIAYRLPRPGHVRLAIYDVRGREVRQLVDGAQAGGERQVAFDGRDNDGQSLPSGVYLYRLQAAGHAETRKISILR